MSATETPETVINRLEKIVADFDIINNSLFRVMDSQIQAIITSDALKVEELSQFYSAMHCDFKKKELELISIVKEVINTSEIQNLPIQLSSVAVVYPQYKYKIEEWKQSLNETTRRLQKKNERVVNLLEFAQSSNASMMHTIYSMYSAKNTHYSSKGSKAGIMSGVAVNQQA
jgi:flagellar biosynthesis/type III secretory pathway chaperone